VLFEAFRQRRNAAHRVQESGASIASGKPKKQKGLGS
jgi:hypothetical protein